MKPFPTQAENSHSLSIEAICLRADKCFNYPAKRSEPGLMTRQLPPFIIPQQQLYRAILFSGLADVWP